jgi:phospholipid/cholesterol/gamma-HCH transport system substrate-binding protein
MPTDTLDQPRLAPVRIRPRRPGSRGLLRLYGIVFLAVLALLLSLTVAVYKKAFTPVVPITLRSDSIGNQLDPPADVKLRGLVVGEVRAVHADGTTATVDIALRPQDVSLIPYDVNARLLPKTLFGEKFVDLVIPARAPGTTVRPIRAGDVITQDRTRLGIELQKLMNDLLPLLRAVQPGELNAALSAFATALEGRGDAIGANLTRLDGYLRGLNPHMDSLRTDIKRLADTARIYADAAPDLLRILSNAITTSRTLADKQQVMASLLTGTTTFADTARGVVDDNAQRLITLNRISRPTLALLDRYSPEYPCLLAGLTDGEPNLEQAFVGGRMHITLEAVLPRAPYRPGEEPRYADRSGPNCRGLPHPAVPAPGVKLNDGTKSNGSGTGLSAGAPSPVSATTAEQHVIGSLVAPVMGVPASQVPPVATLLFGPMARGTAVSVA